MNTKIFRYKIINAYIIRQVIRDKRRYNCFQGNASTSGEKEINTILSADGCGIGLQSHGVVIHFRKLCSKVSNRPLEKTWWVSIRVKKFHFSGRWNINRQPVKTLGIR